MTKHVYKGDDIPADRILKKHFLSYEENVNNKSQKLTDMKKEGKQ